MKEHISWKHVEEARERLDGKVRRTAVMTCSAIDAISDGKVFFKCENLQRTGSFKFRGATNAVASLSKQERERGVVTHSSGNHGQALALAARLHDVRAFVVMPEGAPAVKRSAAEGYGAEVISCCPTYSCREETTAEVIGKMGAVFVHSHDDPRVIAGQGTAAVELVEEVGDLDAILVPVGGGGLVAGTAIALSRLLPKAKVIGCEPSGAGDAYKSMESGRRITDFIPKTIADGLRTPLGEQSFEIIRKLVHEILLVSEEEIVDAMRLVWERMKLLIEPSSAVAVAPLLIGGSPSPFRDRRVGVILSGGNVDCGPFFEALKGSEHRFG